jgi:phage N-6-adenine-methyltransferase
MMDTKVMFSSETDVWSTPQSFFDKYNARHNFDLDVCANHENAKCNIYFVKEVNGLVQRWWGNVWMNPPYGREISKWVEKAYNSVFIDKTANKVVCLLPARTDTKWFHSFCMKGEVEFIKGRLKFGDSKNSAPFPSMVVVFEREV